MNVLAEWALRQALVIEVVFIESVLTARCALVGCLSALLTRVLTRLTSVSQGVSELAVVASVRAVPTVQVRPSGASVT